jgi:hypothetical protein
MKILSATFSIKFSVEEDGKKYMVESEFASPIGDNFRLMAGARVEGKDLMGCVSINEEDYDIINLSEERRTDSKKQMKLL